MPTGVRGRLFTSRRGYFTSQEGVLSMSMEGASARNLSEPGNGQGEKRASGAERTVLQRNPAPAGNQATGTLKLIALAFMLIDHLGVVAFPQIPEMRILGRIAFPIYCWCLVVGFHYTRSVPKYLGRILLTGILSQPLYAYVMNHMSTSGILWRDLLLSKPNIFLTLFLGLGALWGIREKKLLSSFWAPLAAIFLATALNADYGWRGVLFILLLYAARSTRPGVAAVMIAYFLFWGTSYRVTGSFLGVSFDVGSLPSWISSPLSAFLRLETYGLLALPFLLIPFRRNLRLPAWVSYGIYPVHLLMVLLVKTLVR